MELDELLFLGAAIILAGSHENYANSAAQEQAIRRAKELWERTVDRDKFIKD